MISFRYHIVSLVAVFLAMAAGVVGGTTALNGPITSDLRNQVNSLKQDRGTLADQVKTLQRGADDSSQFAATFGSQLVAGVLKGKSVLLVALPGASNAVQSSVSAQIAAAGGRVSGQLQLSANYVQASGADSVNTLATGTHPVGLVYPVTSDARELGASLLSYVLVGKGQPTDLTTVLTGLSSLHMITSNPAGVAASKLVVVVGTGSLGASSYESQAGFDLVAGLQSAGGSVLVVGDTASATVGGIVAMVRNNGTKSTVSTVDDVDSAFGPTSAVLALVGIANSQVGQYGAAAGNDSLFPNPTK